MSQPRFVLVDYRNALYQGGFQNHRREGNGLLLTDTNELFVGGWHKDLMTGPCIVLLDRSSYLVAHFMEGRLNGDYIYVDEKQTLYTEFKDNIPNSNVVVIDKETKSASLL